MEGERGLVAVMAVGDQKLALGEELRHTFGIVNPPEAGALHGEIRIAGGTGERRSPVVEQENRLELSTRSPQQPEPALLRGGVRTLVGQDDAGFVRLGTERADDAEPRPRDAVGPDVVLFERPDRGPLLADEHPLVEPGAKAPARLLLRLAQGQVGHVVRVTLQQRLSAPPRRPRRTVARPRRRTGAHT